jgi:hypothetical protein
MAKDAIRVMVVAAVNKIHGPIQYKCSVQLSWKYEHNTSTRTSILQAGVTLNKMHFFWKKNRDEVYLPKMQSELPCKRQQCQIVVHVGPNREELDIQMASISERKHIPGHPPHRWNR